ncbi:hypothetical protein MHF_0557 [Mycoplasma haemofelis Ohio2]|uniref:Uncharacterized protein n=1 Tax=Mycoplasma haemofelis (strain Ohio2) TaxID=859194 RepID=F6FHY1_MYCHI|nr:hypothetical protein MHF_0557 [Mycoplasma haemofelis Ohio2]
MPSSAVKLLKVGGPILTGIGGVIATSSLVSKSAEEKPEDKIKTKSLNDEDPLIEEWEDRNESEEQSEDDKEAGSEAQAQDEQKPEDSESSDSTEGDQGAEGQAGAPPASDAGDTDSSSGSGETTPSGDAEPPSGTAEEQEGDGDQKEPQGDDGDTGQEDGESGDSSGNENSEGNGTLENGTLDADHNHTLGTAYGTRNEAMTQKDLEDTKQMRDQLIDLKNQLGLISD